LRHADVQRVNVTDLAQRRRTVHNAHVLALAIAVGLSGADVSWTDHSGRCPAAEGRTAIETAAAGFDSARISVEVDEAPGGLSATMRLETEDGADTRTLQSPSCGTLVEAAALITAAAARASVPPPPPAAVPDEPPPPLETPAPTPVEPTPEPTPAAAPAPEPSLALRPTLRASGFTTYGLTPRWSGGGSLGAGLAGEHWRVEATAELLAPSRTKVVPGIRAWGWSAGVRGCGTLGPYTAGIAWQPGLCAGAEAGQLVGRSTGDVVINRHTHVGVWAAASAGPSLRAFVLPRLALALDAEAVVILYRPGFAIGDEPKFQVPVVAPRVSLGLELWFGAR